MEKGKNPLLLNLQKISSKLCNDAEDAKDLNQMTSVKFLQGAKDLGFDNRKSVDAWLYKVSRNTCIDMYRRKRREIPVSLLEPCTNRYDGSSCDADTASLITNLVEKCSSSSEEAARRSIDRLIKVLTPEEKLAINTTNLGGMPVREACDIMNMSQNNFLKLKRRAIMKMRAEAKASDLPGDWIR